MLSRINIATKNITKVVRDIRFNSTKPLSLIRGRNINEIIQKRNILFRMCNEVPHRITGYYVV